jgi:MFS family permease
VTFASCLLFWGRVCDLFSSKHVFCIGFMGLGSTNLVISFLQDQYSFFVFRAIRGVFASCLLPASFRLIVSIMDRHQLSRGFTVYGISGAIANSMGVILGGVVLLIPGSGQMTAWRWYFRIVGIIM